MFSTSKNIENLQDLFVEIRKYLELQRKFVLADFTYKMTKLLSALILGSILFVLITVALFYLSFTCATYLGSITGSMVLGFAIVTVFFILLAIIVFSQRKKLIVRPLTRFIAGLFIDRNDENTSSQS